MNDFSLISKYEPVNKKDKKDAYTYLDLKIKATSEGADIKGYLDSSVISGDSCVLLNNQTSGCMIVLYYNSSVEKEYVSILPR